MQLTDELVDKLDRLADARGIRRSELIRHILASYISKEDEAEKDRRTIEAYTRCPPGGRDVWGDVDEWNEAVLREAGKTWNLE